MASSLAMMMSGIPRAARGRMGAATGGAVAGATLSGNGKRRRRARKRLTNREITELMQLKMLFGARSPIVTLAGLKMLDRGG